MSGKVTTAQLQAQVFAMGDALKAQGEMLAKLVAWTSAPSVAAAPVASATKPTRTRGKGKVKSAKSSTPDWIVQKAQNRAARRTLAASLRAQNKPVSGPAWHAAKLAAGVK